MAGSGWAAWFFNHVYAILLVLILCEGIDILIVLRRFARLEAEQRARLSASNNSHLDA